MSDKTPASHTSASPSITQGESFTCPIEINAERRKVIAAVSAGGLVGGVGAAIPIACTMAPSERAKAAGAPVEIDITACPPGGMMRAEWRGKPVWVINRTPEMLKSLEAVKDKLVDADSKASNQQGNCTNAHRSIKPEYLVAIGICTHLGCSPNAKFKESSEEGMSADWKGGFFCPCHGSAFDLAGRVFKGMPAPKNLDIPPHYYISDTKIFVGADKKV